MRHDCSGGGGEGLAWVNILAILGGPATHVCITVS